MTEVIKEAVLTLMLINYSRQYYWESTVFTTEGDPVRNIDSSVQESRVTILN